MDLVIDANILFAALIKDNITSKLIFEEGLTLYAPEFILIEFEKYRELIVSKTKRNDEEFNEILNLLSRKIEFVPLEEITPYNETASEFCPDEFDVPYMALALKMNIPIWSNDKKLKSDQQLVKISNTQEIVQYCLSR